MKKTNKFPKLTKQKQKLLKTLKGNKNILKKEFLKMENKIISPNPFVPPFKILKHFVFKERFNPYQICKYFFKDHMTKVNSIKNAFSDIIVFGRGSFSMVYEVHIHGDSQPYVLKSLPFSNLDNVNKFRHLMVT
jgi:hypothetical protein